MTCTWQLLPVTFDHLMSALNAFQQGVMLSHANIMSQLRNFNTLIDVHAGDTTLSLLPPWHIYERTTGYFIFQQGTTQVHSAMHNAEHRRFYRGAYTRTCFASVAKGTCQPVMPTLRSQLAAGLQQHQKVQVCITPSSLQSKVWWLSFAVFMTATCGHCPHLCKRAESYCCFPGMI